MSKNKLKDKRKVEYLLNGILYQKVIGTKVVNYYCRPVGTIHWHTCEAKHFEIAKAEGAYVS